MTRRVERTGIDFIIRSEQHGGSGLEDELRCRAGGVADADFVDQAIQSFARGVTVLVAENQGAFDAAAAGDCQSQIATDRIGSGNLRSEARPVEPGGSTVVGEGDMKPLAGGERMHTAVRYGSEDLAAGADEMKLELLAGRAAGNDPELETASGGVGIRGDDFPISTGACRCDQSLQRERRRTINA